jgi:hypothetical protein
MYCVKYMPKSLIITREVRDKDGERKLFPTFVQYSRPVHSLYHVYQKLTVIVTQCLLLPNFEVVIRLLIFELKCRKL